MQDETTKTVATEGTDASTADADACACKCDSCRISALVAASQSSSTATVMSSDSRTITKHDIGDYLELFEEASHCAWPEKTEEPCRWCLHKFKDSFPIGIPVRYDEMRCRMVLRGFFCSFACAAAYLHDQRHNQPSLNVSWLNIMANRCFGVTRIRVAPPREMIYRLEGGIEEFRKLSKEHSYVPIFNARFYEREHEFYERIKDTVTRKRKYDDKEDYDGGGGGGTTLSSSLSATTATTATTTTTTLSHNGGASRNHTKGLKPPPNVVAVASSAKRSGVLAMLGAKVKKH